MRQTLKIQTYIREYRLFLKRLKQARLDAHLTQSEVASLLSRPQSFVPKSESGERRVDFVEVLHLAKIYEKPLRIFMGFVLIEEWGDDENPYKYHTAPVFAGTFATEKIS